MEVAELHEPPILYTEVNIARQGRKIAVLRLHHGATVEGAVEIIVECNCKTMC